MEKHNRFMAELRLLLRRHRAVLTATDGEPQVAFMDAATGEVEGDEPLGYFIYDSEEGGFMEYDDPEWDDISNKQSGEMFLHCGMCSAEFQEGHPDTWGQSPKEYARQQGAWTRQGLQIWCTRHDVNLIHIDFNGQQMRANSTRYIGPMEALAMTGQEGP